ncbi:MAG: aldolase [Dehalococcoidales bacterium]
MILSQFQTVGCDLFNQGLVTSNNGNLSIRLGDRIIITRRSCRLGSIQEQDLIETGITKNDRATPLASMELPVHRAIYQSTSALAIVHGHAPHTIALSLAATEIVPNTAESLASLGRVPVVGRDMEVKPGGLADKIAAELKEHRAAMVYGHGSFASGQLLEEAYKYTATLEESCQIFCLLKSMGLSSTRE